MKVQSKWLYVIVVTFFRQVVAEPPVYNEYSTAGGDGYSPPPPPSPPSVKDHNEGYTYVTPVPAIDSGQKEYDAPVSTHRPPLNSYPSSPVYQTPSKPSSYLLNPSSYIPSPPVEVYRPPSKRKPFKSILYSREHLYKKYGNSLGPNFPYKSRPSPDITTAIFKPRPPSLYAVGGHSKGSSNSYSNSPYPVGYNDVSAPAYYEFSYKIEDYDSASDFGHKEGRNGDMTWGSYSVLLPDGRKQIVEYTADAHGYRPKIRYEDTRHPRPNY